MKPSNVPTGRVTGRFIIGVEDGSDPDDEPDYIAAQGTIELQMSVPYIPNPTADPAPVTMLNARRRMILDAEGYACTPDPTDPTKPGARGMRLEADGSPDALVSGWTWNVTYRFDPVNGSAPSIAAHSFVMLPDAVVDLTTVIKVPSSPGVGLPQSEAAVLRAEGAALESAQSAADAEASALDVVTRANAGEFDGADGNPTAFELRGTGSPLGVVSAPPGTYYTDTAGTLGAWRWLKTSGMDTSGWVVTVGDTGWRRLTPDPAWSGSLLVRRVGSVLHLRGSGLLAAAGGPGTNAGQSIIAPWPAGFVPDVSMHIFRGRNQSSGALGDLRVSNVHLIAYMPAAAGNEIAFSSPIPAGDAWPTTLPGTPI